MKSNSSITLLIALALTSATVKADRFNYLDDQNPYYVNLDFPKLITPQWIGEDGVDAVVILSIDDMRNSATYESYLRPILERLKQIDGRAPISIFTNSIENRLNTSLSTRDVITKFLSFKFSAFEDCRKSDLESTIRRKFD